MEHLQKKLDLFKEEVDKITKELEAAKQIENPSERFMVISQLVERIYEIGEGKYDKKD